MRNNIIDAIKGFGIYLVVIGHLIQNSCSDFDNNIVWRIIYSFHMPLFFFISGFLAYLSKSNGSILVLKRFNSLMIPFFAWAILYYFIRDDSKISLIHYVTDVFITPDKGLWFLWVLFFSYLCLFLTKKIPMNLYLSFIIICLFLLVFCIVIKDKIFGINLIAKQLPFFFIGYLTNKHNKILFVKLKKLKFVILTLYIIGVSFWMRKEDPLFYKYINLGSIFKLFYIFLVGLLGVFSCFSLFGSIKENSKIKILNILSYVGKHTLAIYSIHFLILDYIKINYDGGIIYYLLTIGFSIIAIVLCIIIEYIMSVSSIISKLFFGKQ